MSRPPLLEASINAVQPSLVRAPTLALWSISACATSGCRSWQLE